MQGPEDYKVTDDYDIPGYISPGSKIRVDRPIRPPGEFPPLPPDLEARRVEAIARMVRLKRKAGQGYLGRTATEPDSISVKDQPDLGQ